MKQTVYLITDKYREKFLYRNSSGRWWGVPNNIKDIIHYPTKVVAENQAKWHVDKEEMVVVEFELELNEILPLRDNEYITVENQEEIREALDLFESLGIKSCNGDVLDKNYYFYDHTHRGEYKTFNVDGDRLYTPLLRNLENEHTVTPFKEFKKRF